MNEKKEEKKSTEERPDQVTFYYYFNFKNTKNPIQNLMARTITWTTKEKAKERPKRLEACTNQRRERASPSRDMELFHPQPL
jgi:hypothetical protein